MLMQLCIFQAVCPQYHHFHGVMIICDALRHFLMMVPWHLAHLLFFGLSNIKCWLANQWFFLLYQKDIQQVGRNDAVLSFDFSDDDTT